jgi:hypothetical protein
MEYRSKLRAERATTIAEKGKPRASLFDFLEAIPVGYQTRSRSGVALSWRKTRYLMISA